MIYKFNVFTYFIFDEFFLVQPDLLLINLIKGTGGCFPLHCDSDEKLDKRILTLILYLNDNYQSHHGGELELFPFPYKKVKIQPVQGRMVIFPSSQMIHRVLPSNKERFCLTIWISGNKKQQKHRKNQIYPSKQWELILEKNALRNYFARLIYEQEWKESLMQSHKTSNEKNQILENHQNELLIIQNYIEQFLQQHFSEENQISHLKNQFDKNDIQFEKGLVNWI